MSLRTHTTTADEVEVAVYTSGAEPAFVDVFGEYWTGDGVMDDGKDQPLLALVDGGNLEAFLIFGTPQELRDLAHRIASYADRVDVDG
jgi:hypothetical protein